MRKLKPNMWSICVCTSQAVYSLTEILSSWHPEGEYHPIPVDDDEVQLGEFTFVNNLIYSYLKLLTSSYQDPRFRIFVLSTMSSLTRQLLCKVNKQHSCTHTHTHTHTHTLFFRPMSLEWSTPSMCSSLMPCMGLDGGLHNMMVDVRQTILLKYFNFLWLLHFFKPLQTAMCSTMFAMMLYRHWPAHWIKSLVKRWTFGTQTVLYGIWTALARTASWTVTTFVTMAISYIRS